MGTKANAIVIGAIVVLLVIVGTSEYGTKQFWVDQLTECDRLAGGTVQYCVVPIADKNEINVLTHDPRFLYQRFRFAKDNELTVYAGYYKAATSSLYVDYWKTYGTDE
jgi:hypothetical protein